MMTKGGDVSQPRIGAGSSTAGSYCPPARCDGLVVKDFLISIFGRVCAKPYVTGQLLSVTTMAFWHQRAAASAGRA